MQATADPQDDIALALHLMKTAKTTELEPDLLTAMCEAVYDLGSKSAGGEMAALDSLRLLWQKLPEQRFQWAARRAALWQQAYQESPLPAYGAPLVDALTMAANLGLSSDYFQQAADMWQQALTVAVAIDAPQAAGIRDRLPAFTARRDALTEAAAMAAELRNEKDNEPLRQKMLWFYVTELDQPARALRLVSASDSEDIKTFLPLAQESLERLDKETTLKVAEWYGTLMQRAGTGGKELMAARAQHYYQHFFGNHETLDDDLGLRATRSEERRVG